jgi:hypothetical protein
MHFSVVPKWIFELRLVARIEMKCRVPGDNAQAIGQTACELLTASFFTGPASSVIVRQGRERKGLSGRLRAS